MRAWSSASTPSRIASAKFSNGATPWSAATAALRCSPSPTRCCGATRAEKERRGLLDYDDLIDKTLSLLNNVDAAWVHYKLDLGIDHVLIDEAQDTSDKQWEIVRRLVAEFTAGKGARDLKRTVFAVGDEKQSIFSFQDAAPKHFALMRRHFERAYRGRRA